MELAFFDDADPQIRNEKNLVHVHAQWMEAVNRYNLMRLSTGLLRGALTENAAKHPLEHLLLIQSTYTRNRLERPGVRGAGANPETHHQLMRRISAYSPDAEIEALGLALHARIEPLQRETFRLARLVASGEELSNDLAVEAGTRPLVGDPALDDLIFRLTRKHWGEDIGHEAADDAVLKL